MRCLLPAVVALSLVGSVAGAVDKYLAFGDSITVGSSWPLFSCGGPCPVVFDCTGGCAVSDTQSIRDSCGYVRRLGAWLGGGSYVMNRGWGGEGTAAAVTRFASEVGVECGTPGDCVSVILMHGTNDMDSISPETVRDNVATIISGAKSRNIDVLLMSIIRDYNPSASAWSAYHDLIVDLAGDADLQLVDTHATLCPNAACRSANYFLQGSSPCNYPDPTLSTAHLDPDGYDVITDLIQAAFPPTTPIAPTLDSPVGEIITATPDFVWNESATARWYRLDVNGAVTWWEGAAVCSGGSCTASPGISLGPGVHSWQVLGRNLRGLGSPSAPTEFGFTPEAPTALAPSGELFQSAPRYEWTEVDGASEYDLEVRDDMGNLEASAISLLATTVCWNGRCSVVEGTELTEPGGYTVEVRGRNTIGEGPWSALLAFTVLECTDPSQKDLSDYVTPPLAGPASVRHCGPLTAAATAPFEIEETGDLSVLTREEFIAFDGFTVKGQLSVRTQ